MALDGAFLSCLREELARTLADARIDKIHQPSREELVIALRTRAGAYKLYLSARAGTPRVHLSDIALENPAAPPMFCMLLRKRLTGGRLVGIRQPGWERALYFDLDCVSDLGDLTRLTLAVEIMGRHSNIILVGEDGLVIDAIKRVDLDMSSVRPVLPGLPYSPPPRQLLPDGSGKLDLSESEPAVLVDAAVARRGGPLSAALLAVSHGLSPLLCREAAHLATRGMDTDVAALSDEERRRAAFYLGRIRDAVLTGENRKPFILYKSDRSPLDFSFMTVTQYGLDAVGRDMESFSALLDAFYAQRDAAERTKQRAADILRVLTNASDRLTRKLAVQRREQEQSTDRERLRICGELINAGAHAIPKGASEAELVDYYDPECRSVRVKLDPALSAAANAQKYYKDYRRAQTAERVLAEQITRGERELAYVDTVFDALSRAATLRELEELREELVAAGYLRAKYDRKQKPPPSPGPHAYTSDDGFSILVGRNNLQNDKLTLRTAKGSDIWLHTKNIPGSHVVILTGGKTPPDRTVEQAAVLAALHSKAAASKQVPVDYTPVKHVKKPSGARPGFVIYETNQTAYVDPDPALAARLLDKPR